MESYNGIVSALRKSQRNGRMKSYNARLEQLQAVYRMMKENEDVIAEALMKDLHKCKQEGYLMETMQVLIDCGNAIQQLKDWMKPSSVKPDLVNIATSCYISSEPLGVALIIGAWNYPVQLVFLPLIGALAAGNCAVVKPSEVSSHTAKCVTNLIEKYLDPEVVRVINGGVPETTALLKERFDIILYTGCSSVGKIVMRAASEHLTPVVLELGGKCPAIVDSTCNYDAIAQRIVWAKFANAGQTCLAVDYIMCVSGCQKQMIESLKKAIIKFYGADQQKSDSYGRIINERHFKRISKLINESKVVYGNKQDISDLYISPTIMADVTVDDDVMSEEIFGPLLPLISVDSVDDAIDFAASREKPLALYIFSNDSRTVDAISSGTSSGGLVINDALVHGGVPKLPFGGVGCSGMGAYHGKASFDVFSHKKSVLRKDQRLESLNTVRYPPYDPNWKVFTVLKSLIIPKGVPSWSYKNVMVMALFGAVVGFIVQFVMKSRT